MVSNKFTSSPRLQRPPATCHKGPLLPKPGPLIIPPTFPIQIAQALIAPNGFTWFLAGCGPAHYEPLINAWLCHVEGTARDEGDEIAVWATTIVLTPAPTNLLGVTIGTTISAATPFGRSGQDTHTLPQTGPFTYHSPILPMFTTALGSAQINTIDF